MSPCGQCYANAMARLTCLCNRHQWTHLVHMAHVVVLRHRSRSLSPSTSAHHFDDCSRARSPSLSLSPFGCHLRTLTVCVCLDDRVKTSRDGEKERERDKVQLCQHYSSSPSPLLCMSSTCHTDMMTSLQGSKKCAPARIILKLCLRIDWMCGHGMHRNVMMMVVVVDTL